MDTRTICNVICGPLTVWSASNPCVVQRASTIVVISEGFKQMLLACHRVNLHKWKVSLLCFSIAQSEKKYQYSASFKNLQSKAIKLHKTRDHFFFPVFPHDSVHSECSTNIFTTSYLVSTLRTWVDWGL